MSIAPRDNERRNNNTGYVARISSHTRFSNTLTSRSTRHAQAQGLDAGIILPYDPWSAIVRGAVWLDANVMVDDRECHGIRAHEGFDPNKRCAVENRKSL